MAGGIKVTSMAGDASPNCDLSFIIPMLDAVTILYDVAFVTDNIEAISRSRPERA
jgi:hypothetical protein